MIFFPTVDEDFQYFRSQGYTGSLNDMHYKAMGDLGYTGALSDRIHAFLTFKYGSFYEAMRDLRNGTSVFSLLSSYSVNGLDPALVFDFVGNYFRKSATDSTFGASITHSATTNATMVDSDGLLKWRPHNRVKSSGDLTGTGWSTVRAAYDGPTETLTQVGTTIQGFVVQTPASLTIGARYKYTIRMKAGNTGWGVVAHVMTNVFWVKTWFDLSNGVVGTVGANTTATIVNAGDGWWDCSVEAVANRTSANISAQIATSDGAVNAPDGDTVLVRQVHDFRSDLGGMVNNPDTASSYVPTTTTPVYLSRRGHHIYNGDAWVNEGVLHESEARTNLLLYSQDLSVYGKTNCSVTSNSTIAPDGTTTADKLSIATTNSSFHFISQGITMGAVAHTASAFFKAGEITSASIFLSQGGNVGGLFNLSTGVATANGTGNTASMVDVGNGWYHCSVTNDGSASVSGIRIGIGNGALGSFVGVIGQGIFAWGAQLEAGSTPSSYIPTTTATVTRAAETLTVPAANLPYNSTNMSIQIDGKMTYANRGAVETVGFFRWYLNSGTNIATRLNTNGVPAGNVYTTGVGYNLPSVYSPGVNVPFNIAARYGSTFTNLATDGTAYTASTYGSASANLSSTNLNLGDIFMGTIGEFRMWSDDLGDVGITEATLPSTEPSLSLTFDGSENSFIVLDWSE